MSSFWFYSLKIIMSSIILKRLRDRTPPFITLKDSLGMESIVVVSGLNWSY